MRKSVIVVLLGMALVLAARFAAAGAIRGKVANPKKCLGVRVLLREGQRDPRRPKVFTATFNPTTGEFRSPDLEAGRYDLRFLIRDGVFEGVDMAVLPPEEGDPQPLIPRDYKDIEKTVMNPVAAFMDIHRLLAVRGHAKRAAGLVEMVRYRKQHGRPRGEIVWGVEVWFFENWTGAWVRPPASRGRRKVIRRIRVPADMPAEKFDKMVCLFSPEIGGLEVGPNKSVSDLSVTIPEPTVSLGKVPGSVRKQVEEDRRKNPDRFD